MGNLWEDKLLRDHIESCLIDHCEMQGKPRNFIWRSLPGTGSTSDRGLVHVSTGNELKHFVVKRFRIPQKPFEESQNQAKREYTTLEYLQAHRGLLWRTPHPIAILPDFAVIIMEYFPGANLSTLFWQAIRLGPFSRIRKKWLLTLMRDIAAIILGMQSYGMGSDALMRADEAWYSTFIEEQIEELKRLGISSSILAGVGNRIKDALPALISEENRRFQHTDLFFNNILHEDGKYCVLDFPNACAGTRYWDVSHILVALEHYKLFRNVDTRIIDRCREEFRRNFILDDRLFGLMQLVHYCFALKVSLTALRRGVQKILLRDPRKFYEDKIQKLLDQI